MKRTTDAVALPPRKPRKESLNETITKPTRRLLAEVMKELSPLLTQDELAEISAFYSKVIDRLLSEGRK